MPPPIPPHLQSLAFPTAKAEEAKAVCDRIAALLGEHLEARGPLVRTARDEWQGGHREEFDATWSPQEHRLAGMKESLQTLSGNIDDVLENVASENSRRAEARAEFVADHAGAYPV